MPHRYNREDRARAGRIAARVVYDKFGFYFRPEVLSGAGVLGSHVRWHKKRGIFNMTCSVCKANSITKQADAEGDAVIEVEANAAQGAL